MITSAQKKALTEAGYSVKGNTVLNKSGKTVGGYNKNGNIFAGSSTVRDILKSKPEEKKAPAPKKPAAKKEPPVTEDGMEGYREGDVTTEKLKKPRRKTGRAADTINNRGQGKTPRNKTTRTPNTINNSAGTSVSDSSTGTRDRKQRRDDKRKKDSEDNAGTFLPLVAAAVRRVEGKRAGPRGGPYNPNYSGKPGGPTGYQGKYETGVARTGGGRAAPLNLRGSSSGRLTGGAGKVVARNKFDEIMNMNKGGMVKANCGASMKPARGKK